MGASDAFRKLNARQREAAQAPSRPLLIIAGAGTGKTSTLAHRVAHLDLAGEPRLDEDCLVLSTVHSAKGQEWEAVYLLHVTDGNFPNEFATGKPEAIAEERRLLYVAMTRAKTRLDLIVPLKYYVTQQSRMGDRHVYGAQSRFLTPAVMACLEPVAYGESSESARPAAQQAPVDVASRLRDMWA